MSCQTVTMIIYARVAQNLGTKRVNVVLIQLMNTRVVKGDLITSLSRPF
jgi:hypothetical protein